VVQNFGQNLKNPQFEVNEALLVETIAFYTKAENDTVGNFQISYGSNAVIVFDLVIGNKRVMKDTPVFASGSPYTFANTGQFRTTVGVDSPTIFSPRHQVFMEGAGVLIPPQVQWSLNYTIFNVVTGAIIPPEEDSAIGCYLFGTKVLLNFNTSI